MKIATVYGLEPHRVPENNPGECTGDLVAQMFAAIRQHVENACLAIEAERRLPSGPERPPRRSILAELKAAFGQLLDINRILNYSIRRISQEIPSASLENVDEHLPARAVKSLEKPADLLCERVPCSRAVVRRSGFADTEAVPTPTILQVLGVGDAQCVLKSIRL